MVGRRLLLVLALASAAPVWADEWELLARRGENGRHYDGAGLALRLAPGWSKDWGSWHFSLRPELELNRFRYTGPDSGPRHMNQAGINGLLRLHFGGQSFRPHVEIGLGIAGFADDKLGRKDFSTHFQFSEHVGLGAEIGGRWLVGWRFSHYSNANIERPNDGIDLHQVVLGVRF